jgi:hypothetical protein
MKRFAPNQRKRLVSVLAMPAIALAAFLMLPKANAGGPIEINPGTGSCTPGMCVQNSCPKERPQVCNSDGASFGACGSCG